MGFKGQNTVRQFEIYSHERRVFDGDPDFLDWRDQKILPVLKLQNRRKQLHQFKPADWRAHVKPCAIAFDLHVQIATKGRIPQMNRGQATPFGSSLGRSSDSRSVRCHDILSNHSFAICP